MQRSQDGIKKLDGTMHRLDENITAYFKNKKEVVAVFLFGSYAEGKDRVLSDIDIGILLDRNSRDFFNERKNDYIVELGRIMRKDIDPVILNLAGEELLRQVFSKGRCILVNNSRKLSRYKTVMFSKIAEFGYYRNRMQSGLIRKIMEG